MLFILLLRASNVSWRSSQFKRQQITQKVSLIFLFNRWGSFDSIISIICARLGYIINAQQNSSPRERERERRKLFGSSKRAKIFFLAKSWKKKKRNVIFQNILQLKKKKRNLKNLQIKIGKKLIQKIRRMCNPEVFFSFFFSIFQHGEFSWCREENSCSNEVWRRVIDDESRKPFNWVKYIKWLWVIFHGKNK